MMPPETTLLQQLTHAFISRHPDKSGAFFGKFSTADLHAFLLTLPEASVAPAAAAMNPETLATLLETGDPGLSIKLGKNADPVVLAMALGSRKPEERIILMKEFSAPVQKEIEEYLVYPQDTAGAMMHRKVVRGYPQDTVLDALKKVREAKNPYITDICLCNAEGVLTGTLSLQQLALADDAERLSDLVASPPRAVQDVQSSEDAFRLREEMKLASVPVVDYQFRLVGIIRSDTLVTQAQKDSGEDLQAMFGAGRDEKGLSKVAFSVSKRLPWLQINLLTAFLASAVVGLFEGTIAKITALAVLMPVVAGQSGNSGSQALAVTMRALALREIRPAQWFILVRKEAMAGLINGVAVSLVTGVVVYFWSGSMGLPIVISLAMILSMTLAGIAGALIPIGLKIVGQDPALSSTILLTTVTDVVGFLSFLGLAALMANILHLTS